MWLCDKSFQHLGVCTLEKASDKAQWSVVMPMSWSLEHSECQNGRHFTKCVFLNSSNCSIVLCFLTISDDQGAQTMLNDEKEHKHTLSISGDIKQPVLLIWLLKASLLWYILRNFIKELSRLGNYIKRIGWL